MRLKNILTRRQIMTLPIFLKRTVLFVFIPLLVACSTGKIVQTYDGEVLLSEQLAVLMAPANISIVSVNGRSVPTYLLSSIDTNYGLKVGENRIVFKYESIWGRAVKRNNDESRAESVTSELQVVMVSAKPGKRYLFDFVRPNNVREAKAFVSDVLINIFDENNVLVAESAAYIESLPAGLETNNSGALLAEAVGNAEKGEEVSTIVALKALWRSATETERKAFLAWAFKE
jgi:uncharacterized protein YccT (UPF0319 family)